jgi:DNA-binding NarL/FixJ family response regulator
METTEILILTRSIVLQHGLIALLQSLPEVTQLKALDDLPSALDWIKANQPEVILFDDRLLGEESKALLLKIKSLSPRSQLVLLSDDVKNVDLLANHVEDIIIKGAAPSVIASIVIRLLSANTENVEAAPGSDKD